MDDDDGFEEDQPDRSQRFGAPQQRPYLARRLMALVVGVGIIILIVIGFKACLDNRKERAFENYNSDLVAIAVESQQLSDDFFKLLGDPGNLDEAAFRAQVLSDRGTAESLLARVEGLDAPDEVAGAQDDLVTAYELRADGISGIAEQVDTALGTENESDALDQIAVFMRYFLASDVLYQRAREEINTTIDEEDVPVAQDERLPEENFLPDDSFLDVNTLSTAFSGVAIGGECPPGVHGLARVNTVINDTELTPDALTVVAGGPPYTITVTAENQGDTEETAVPVEAALSGGEETFEGSAEIERIEPGASEDAEIEIDPEPATGQDLTLEVNVLPVCDEQVTENNMATFQVNFE